ncbi:metallophosphoesterase [Nanoarchaeota archaeon]
MKLLAFVDLHADESFFKALKKKVSKQKPDAIICAGDFTSFGSGTKTWLKKLESFKIPTFIIPGNHETEEELIIYTKNLKYVKNIHLKSHLFGDVLFIGCGGGGLTEAHAAFEQSEKEFSKDIKKLKIKDKRHKIVLVVHQPPYKTKLDYLWWMKDYAGSTSIRKFIEKYQPSLCITGHLHENFNKEDKIKNTKIINPGPKGKIIKL